MEPPFNIESKVSTMITKTCPCNIVIFEVVKNEIFSRKFVIFFLFLLKT